MRLHLRATIVVLALTGCEVIAQSPMRDDLKRFIGTWRLVSIVEDGRPVPARGSRPTGLMFLDAKGNLSVQIMPDTDRPAWPDGRQPTPEQAKAALTGYSAFFGTFTVDLRTQTITYHRRGDIQPGNVGVDLRRHYEFIQNRLTLTPEDYPNRQITWELLR